MKKYLLSVFTFFLLIGTLQAQRFEWMKIFSSTGFSSGVQSHVVKGNNVFVAGEYQGNVSFGTTVLNSLNSGRDIYVANYDTLGNFRWAVSGGGTSFSDDFIDLEVDANGNVYIIGTYTNSITWGGTSISAQTGGGSAGFRREGYIVKLNNLGVAQWIRAFYTPGTNFSTRGLGKLSISSNRVFVAGIQTNDIRVTGSPLILTQPSSFTFNNNLFVGVFDLSGNLQSLDRIITGNPNTLNSNSIGDIEAINDSSYYFSASLRGQYTVGSNNLSIPSTTTLTPAIAKFTKTNCDWLVRQSNTPAGFSNSLPQLAISPNGDLFCAGTARGTFTVQGNTISPPSSFSNFDDFPYFLKLNSSGNVQNLAGLNIRDGEILDATVTSKNELVVSGSFEDSLTLNNTKRFSNGSRDHLILNFDSNLSLNWFQTGGGGNDDDAFSVACDNSPNAYVFGTFRGLSQFGTTFFSGNAASTSNIIYKLSECGETPVPLSFNGDTNLCLGQNVRIIANPPAGATFRWLKNSTLLAGEVFRDLTVNSSGNYQVIVNGSGCIDTSRAVPVNVGTPPTVTYNQNDTVCEQASPITLSGGLPAGGFYRGPGVVNNTFDPSITGIGNQQVWYIFSNGGCADSASSTIFVEPAPTVFFAPIPSICETSSPITLTNAFPPGGIFSGNGVSGNQFDPSTAGSGPTTITYTFTGAGGCSSSVDQIIQVDTLTTVSFNPLAAVCSNSAAVTLTAGVPSGGVYSGPGVTNGEFDPSITGTGTFTLNYSFTNQCGTTTSSQNITVNPAPTVSLGSFNDLCESDAAITLTGGTPSGGTYSGIGVSGSSFDPAVSGVGTFTIFYDFTDAQGCSNRDSASINVNALPTTSITNDTAICLGNSINLTASGGTSYLWSNGATTASTSVSPTSTTTYSVTVTNANNCSVVENVTVTVNPLPTANISGNNTICAGSSTTLTASGGQTYIWSNGSNTAAITVSPTANTSYTVTATDASGCTDTETFNVNVNALPTVSLGSFNDLCEGNAPITLTGGTPSGGTYSGIGVSGTSFDPAISGVGTFTLFYDFTDAQGCSNRDSASINVNALPTSSITNDTAICLGNSINLIASGGTSYLWSNGANTASTSVSPTSTTSYSVTITNANNCSEVENVTVTVNPLPTANIIGNNTICAGNSTTLTASGGQTYNWSNGSNTASIIVSPTANTTYTVTATDASGCTDTESFNVNVNPLPTVSLGSFNDLCEGDAPITLTGGTPSGGTYSGIGVSGTSFDPAVSGVGTFTIFYDFTDAQGCSNRDSASITVNALPTTSITNDTAICLGNAINLTASGGSSYLWSNGSNTASTSVSPTSTTTYSVTVTNANNCSVVENVTVTVNPLPTANISGNNTICAGSSTTLTASGGQTYNWSNGSNTAAITVSPTANTTYTVTVTDAAGCTDTESFNVNVNALPTVSLGSFNDLCEGDAAITLTGGTPSGGTYSGIGVSGTSFDPAISGVGTFTLFYDFTDAQGCSSRDSASINVNALPTTSITNDTAICLGNSINLTASGGTSYLWSNGANTASTSISPTSTTTYSVTVSNANNCSAVENVTVTVNPLPQTTVSSDTTICLGDTVQLSVNAAASSFLWSTGESSVQITVNPINNTSYSVTTTNAQQCSFVDVINVTVNTGTALSIGPDTTLDPVTTTSFTYDAGAGFASYLWQDNSTAQTLTVNYDPAKAGTTEAISVIAGNSSGCPSLDTAFVFYDVISSLANRANDEQLLSISPNPTTDFVNLKFNYSTENQRIVRLFDLKGKLVLNQTINNNAGNYRLGFLNTQVNKGVYLISIEEGNQLYREKIVVQ